MTTETHTTPEAHQVSGVSCGLRLQPPPTAESVTNHCHKGRFSKKFFGATRQGFAKAGAPLAEAPGQEQGRVFAQRQHEGDRWGPLPRVLAKRRESLQAADISPLHFRK